MSVPRDWENRCKSCCLLYLSLENHEVSVPPHSFCWVVSFWIFLTFGEANKPQFCQRGWKHHQAIRNSNINILKYSFLCRIVVGWIVPPNPNNVEVLPVNVTLLGNRVFTSTYDPIQMRSLERALNLMKRDFDFDTETNTCRTKTVWRHREIIVYKPRNTWSNQKLGGRLSQASGGINPISALRLDF